MIRAWRALAFLALALIVPACDDDRDVFVLGATLRLHSPQGPGGWVVNSVHTVRWSTENGSIGTVDIEISLDHATWTTLVAGTANDGAEPVTAPAAVASPVWVRVRQSGGPASDETRTPISIVATDAQLFVEAPTGLLDLSLAAADWGDFDNDGDFDLVISGRNGEVSPVVPFTEIYRNDRGTLVSINAGLTDLEASAVAWGDFDNDGDLDLAISGADVAAVQRTIIYRNDSGVFVNINAVLPGAEFGSLAWGDFDNDGDLDLAWSSGSGCQVFRNVAGTFTSIGASFGSDGICGGVHWGDYDNDGDLDLLLKAGSTGRIFRNDAGVFVDSGVAIPLGSPQATASWGDFDNDGDLDVAAPVSLFQNDAGVFSAVGSGISLHRPIGGDFDNDGDLDLVGVVSPAILRNDSGTFVNMGVSVQLFGINGGRFTWVDVDGDGDLDCFGIGSLSGGISNGVTRLYRNLGADRNTAPTAPTGLAATPTAGGVTLAWNPSSDAETPALGLSYSIQIGIGGLPDSYPSMFTTGVRRVSAPGPTRPGAAPGINLTLPAGTYSWSVQAVDPGMKGSAWAAVGTFTIP